MQETAETGKRSLSSKAFIEEPLREDCLKRLDSYARSAGSEVCPARRRSENWFVAHGPAVAAAAAGVGMLAMAPPVEAGIIYTQINIPLHAVTNAGVELFPISVAGAVRFSFGASVFANDCCFAAHLSEAPMSGNALIAGPLAKGYEIGPSGIFNFGRVVLASGFAIFNFSGQLISSGSDGPWAGPGGKSGYLGLEFQLHGQAHYGWVALTANQAGVGGTVTDYAYDTVANQGIGAGVTGTPEPGTLGLLALGALGLGFWRRRKAVAGQN